MITGKGDDYKTGCLLDYIYSLDVDPKAIQQINFTANLGRLGNTRIYFILEESKET